MATSFPVWLRGARSASARTDLNRQVPRTVGRAFLPALGRQECLPHLSTEVGWGTRVFCAALLVGVGLIASQAAAQSDGVAEAPWQAHPCQGQMVPPPASPCPSCGGNDCGGGACGDAHGPCDDECSQCSVTDWCHWPIFEPCGQLSFRGEYLGWWTKSSPMPALATSSPVGTPRDQAGVIGQPGTQILFSADDGDQGTHSGVRLGLGYWFTPCRESGLDLNYTLLGNKATTFAATDTTNPILARPFFDVSTAAQNSLIIAYPNEQTGSLNISDASELDSVEVLFRRGLLRQSNRELDLLIGYRYGRLDENIAIDQASNYLVTVGGIPAGTAITASDLFATSNEFNGGEIGFAARTRCCRWSLELLTKLAVGNTRSRTTILGNTVVTPPSGQGQQVQYDAGVLAQPTNIGYYERNDFSVIPEFGLTLGYDVTCRLKATFGWSFLYWSSVMRPADQIDTNVNSTQLPPGTLRGVPAPVFRPVTTDFWAQGFNLGLEYRY
ncbi:MAG: BBP7 family outer membrane beta-barrel protein [Thermoguttaceae bacterium]